MSLFLFINLKFIQHEKEFIPPFCNKFVLAFTPAKKVNIENANAPTLKDIVHSFHVVTTGSDAVSYYVTLDFNLSTQLFGVITAHSLSDPYNELDCTLDFGDGDTTGGNGSTIETTNVTISIDNTSITIDIPDDTYTFDY